MHVRLVRAVWSNIARFQWCRRDAAAAATARGSRTSLLINLENFKRRHRHTETTAAELCVYFVLVHRS